MADVRVAGTDDYDPFEAFDRAQGAESGVDPYPRFAELLAEAPVMPGGAELIFPDRDDPAAALAPAAPPFTLLSFGAVETALRDHGSFSSRGYADSMGVVMGHTILEMDEPEHHEYRSLIQQAFTRREMERWRTELVEPVVAEHLDALAARGEADLVRELTFSFPNTVIARAMGLPEEDRPQFYRWAVEITNIAVEIERGLAASAALADYFGRLISERRDAPGDDLISLLAACELDGHRLTDEEIIAFLRLLLPAGSETTYRSSSNLLVGLLTHPEQLDAVRSDRSLVTAAIEEGLRWETPLTGIARTTTRDVELEGVPIPAGSPVHVCLGAANHDPSRWQRPHDFDISRPMQPHVSFATGNHLCLGLHLARMETEVLLEAVLDRLVDLRIDPDRADEADIVGVTFRAPRRIPVRFTAAG